MFDGTNATVMAVTGWRMMLPRAVVTARGMTAWNSFANDDAWSGVRLDEGGDVQVAGRVDATTSVRGAAVEGGIQVERTSQRRRRERYIASAYRPINNFDAHGTRAGAYAIVRWTAGPRGR